MIKKELSKIRSADRKKNITKVVFDKSLEIVLPCWYSAIRDMASSVWLNNRQKYFDEFLLGLDNAFSRADENTKSKIYKKFQDKLNDVFLGEIINSVLFSKSTVCRIILGLIAAKYLQGNHVDYSDATIIFALKDLLDEDLVYFEKFYNISCEITYSGEADKGLFFVNEYSEAENISFQKMQSLQIIG